MARYKYYMSYQHDHEACTEEETGEYHKFTNLDDSKLTPDQKEKMITLWEKDDLDDYYKYIDTIRYADIQNKRTGAKLIIRVSKNGKSTVMYIQSPYCDFQEHFRERIKAPKGYMKRLKGGL